MHSPGSPDAVDDRLEAPLRQTRNRSLWAHANFRRLWLAGTVSVVGNEISAVTIPLVAVTVLKAGSGATALLTAAGL